ncbi:DsbE family thiol:disulfide interchange protein [Candidatus Pelagibacter sp.]|nr:DsbE family thiol:disulfide interchange protein [Candidatus Pelagibacter sp.]|tara:strand:+ start:3765 stop:4289 length:525 start_codon:yes stop_codon:yes gene_type:complete
MKNKILSFLSILILIFVFTTFYKGLEKSNIYEPQNSLKKIPEFSMMTFFESKEIYSKDIFRNNDFYLINIWASWCVPCRDEHQFLVSLSKNNRLEIIGINYKDNYKNAERFLIELGNPYSKILVDKDGTKAIEWGAIGVPETFLVYENKILKKIIGPLNSELAEEIERIVNEKI